MNIRTAVKKLKKEDMATIFLNNGTVIYIREMTVADRDMLGHRKYYEDEFPVLRELYVTITPSRSEKTNMLTDIQEYKITDFGKDDEYLIPEKVMNLFIKANEEIDEGRTFPAFIYNVFNEEPFSFAF